MSYPFAQPVGLRKPANAELAHPRDGAADTGGLPRPSLDVVVGMVTVRACVETSQLRGPGHEKAVVTHDYSPQDAAVLRAISALAIELGLSQRQLELLTRLTRGLSREEVADEMGVTVAAVDYDGRIIRKLCGTGPRELVMGLLRTAVVAAAVPPGHERSAPPAAEAMIQSRLQGPG